MKRHLDGTESEKTIAKFIAVILSVSREWIRRYEYLGEKAFKKYYAFYLVHNKVGLLYYGCFAHLGNWMRSTSKLKGSHVICIV